MVNSIQAIRYSNTAPNTWLQRLFTDHVMLSLLCFFWFVESPFLLPWPILVITEAVRLCCFGSYILYFMIQRRMPPWLGLMGWMIIIGVPLDLLSGNIPIGFHPVVWVHYIRKYFWQGPIGLIILTSFFVDSRIRLVHFIKAFVFSVTVSISLVGFFQLYTGHLLADYSPIAYSGILYYHSAGRLVGLIYGCSNEAATFILAALGIIMGRMLVKPDAKSFFLFSINIISLAFTFTRGAYIAFGLMILGFILFVTISKKLLNSFFWLLVICCLIILSYMIFSPLLSDWLYLTGDARRFFGLREIESRITIYEAMLAHLPNALLGTGLGTDLWIVMSRIVGQYITPHNFVFDWVLFFGLPATLFFLVLLILSLKRLLTFVGSSTSPGYMDKLGIGLFLSYIGIIGNALTTGDAFYLIPLWYMLCRIYIRYGHNKRRIHSRRSS